MGCLIVGCDGGGGVKLVVVGGVVDFGVGCVGVLFVY